MYLLSQPILSLIGFLYSRLRYKDKQLMEKIRFENTMDSIVQRDLLLS